LTTYPNHGMLTVRYHGWRPKPAPLIDIVNEAP
jgi:hypothetical protein